MKYWTNCEQKGKHVKWSHKKCATLALLYSTRTSVSVHWTQHKFKQEHCSVAWNEWREKKTHTYCSWNTRCQHIVHILCITCTGFPYPWMRGWTCMYCTVYKCTCGVLLWIFAFSIRTINMIKAIVSLGFMRKYRFSSKTKQKNTSLISFYNSHRIAKNTQCNS